MTAHTKHAISALLAKAQNFLRIEALGLKINNVYVPLREWSVFKWILHEALVMKHQSDRNLEFFIPLLQYNNTGRWCICLGFYFLKITAKGTVKTAKSCPRKRGFLPGNMEEGELIFWVGVCVWACHLPSEGCVAIAGSTMATPGQMATGIIYDVLCLER